MQAQFSKIKKRRGANKGVASLNLTSLVDIFTIILLFLLMNYSIDTDVLVPNAKLSLPLSTSKDTPKQRLVIQVSTEDIIVDGIAVARVSDVMGIQDDPFIAPVVEALNNNTRKTEFIASKNITVKFTGEVMIQADRNMPFLLLEKIMYSCGQAGYGNISLAVVSNE